MYCSLLRLIYCGAAQRVNAAAAVEEQICALFSTKARLLQRRSRRATAAAARGRTSQNFATIDALLYHPALRKAKLQTTFDFVIFRSDREKESDKKERQRKREREKERETKREGGMET